MLGRIIRWTLALVLWALLSPAASAQTAPHCDVSVPPGGDIAAALKQLPAQGERTLCLAAGDYRLTHMLRIERGHLRLQGQGKATRVQLKDGVSSPLIVIGDAEHRQPAAPIEGVTLTSMQLIGGGQSAHEFYPPRPYLSNSVVVVRAGQQVTLQHLDVSRCRSACLLTEYDSRDVTIRDNHIHGAIWDGISLNRAGPTRVIDNLIDHNTAAGITVEHLEGGLISGNRIRDNGSQGIYLADAADNRVTGNTFSHNREAGVFLTCSVHTRDPVLCWKNSMSLNNVFQNNRFDQNRFGFQVAADAAANCRDDGRRVNLSLNNRFNGDPNQEPAPDRFGHCLRFGEQAAK